MGAKSAIIESEAVVFRREHAANHGVISSLNIPFPMLDRVFSSGLPNGQLAERQVPVKDDINPYETQKKDSFKLKSINKFEDKVYKQKLSPMLIDDALEKSYKLDDRREVLGRPIGQLTRLIMQLSTDLLPFNDNVNDANKHYVEHRQVYIAMALAEAAERGVAINLAAGSNDAINVRSIDTPQQRT